MVRLFGFVFVINFVVVIRNLKQCVNDLIVDFWFVANLWHQIQIESLLRYSLFVCSFVFLLFFYNLIRCRCCRHEFCCCFIIFHISWTFFAEWFNHIKKFFFCKNDSNRYDDKAIIFERKKNPIVSSIKSDASKLRKRTLDKNIVNIKTPKNPLTAPISIAKWSDRISRARDITLSHHKVFPIRHKWYFWRSCTIKSDEENSHSPSYIQTNKKNK